MTDFVIQPSGGAGWGGGWRRRAISMVASVSLVTASLTGCTTQQSRIGTDDGTDSCRAYVVALDSTGNYYAEDMIQGAMIGAVGGALMGGLLSGSWKGAAVGAAAGAVAGAIGGYWQNRMQQGRDQAILSVVSDMRHENEQLDKTNGAFQQLSDCRHREAAQIKAQYAAKAISREEAQSRLRHLASLARKDLEILNTITANSNKRVSEYQYAAAQIDPSLPPPAPEPVYQPPATPEATRTVTPRHTPTAAPKPRVTQRPESSQQFASLQAKNTSLNAGKASYAQDVGGWENGVT